MSTEEPPLKNFTVTHVIDNLSTVKDVPHRFTKKVEQYNVPWTICYLHNNDHLSLFLHCEKDRLPEEEWSFHAGINLSIVSTNGIRFTKTFVATYGNTSEYRGYGLGVFITWEELIKRFVTDDTFIVEGNVTLTEMTGIHEKDKLKNFGDDTAKAMSDVTLKVEDKKFYVSKFTLANQSTVFKSMFFGNFEESRKSEITLKDIAPVDFQTFLEVVHLEPTLTDSSIEGVLHIADMYDAKNVTRICEEYLMQKSNLSAKTKIQIGIRFSLNDLKKSCIDSLKSVMDVRAVMSSDKPENALKDPEILNALVEKLLSFV